jgi:hypothetical protein
MCSLWTLSADAKRCAPVRAQSLNHIFTHFPSPNLTHPRTPATETLPVLYGSTPQLTLWYESMHCHGPLFLHELERSTEWSKSALTGPPPKETSSLDLHHQERSSQAGAVTIDDMHTVYCHTHGIITSSNAPSRTGDSKVRIQGTFVQGWAEQNRTDYFIVDLTSSLDNNPVHSAGLDNAMRSAAKIGMR